MIYDGFAVKGEALDLCDGLGGCFGRGHADEGLSSHPNARMGYDVENGSVLLEERLEGLLHHYTPPPVSPAATERE